MVSKHLTALTIPCERYPRRCRGLSCRCASGAPQCGAMEGLSPEVDAKHKMRNVSDMTLKTCSTQLGMHPFGACSIP